MLAAHMDEIGLMITREEGNGFFYFDLVGGIDKRQLVGKAVWIGKDHVPGVIGTKPIHLLSKEEMKNSLDVDNLRIDVGPENKGKVKLGDRVVFANPFRRIGESIRAKATDDRLGVATLIELLKGDYPNLDLVAAFTVQEEIGLRGARVASYALDPQIAIVLDCTPAYDLPDWEVDRGKVEENPRYNTRLGGGAAIYVADGRTLSDPRLLRFFVEIAEEQGIQHQIRQPGGGGTDAGAIHQTREGIPTISISVPGRYIHTFASIVRIEDWQNTIALLQAALARLTPEVLREER
jgi:endoglucanase